MGSMHYFLTFVYLAVMIVLNLLIYKKYKLSRTTTNFIIRVKYFNDNDNLEIEEDNESRLISQVYEDNRITLMVIWISCVFIVDHLLSILVPTIAFIAFGKRFRTYLKVSAFVVLFRSISSILNTLFYYIFYHKYRKIMKKNFSLLVFVIIFTTLLVTYVLIFFFSLLEL